MICFMRIDVYACVCLRMRTCTSVSQSVSSGKCSHTQEVSGGWGDGARVKKTERKMIRGLDIGKHLNIFCCCCCYQFIGVGKQVLAPLAYANVRETFNQPRFTL